MEKLLRNEFLLKLNGGRLSSEQMKMAVFGLAGLFVVIVWLSGLLFNLALVVGAAIAGTRHCQLEPHLSSVLAFAKAAVSNLPVPPAYGFLAVAVASSGVVLYSGYLTLLIWMAGAYKVGMIFESSSGKQPDKKHDDAAAPASSSSPKNTKKPAEVAPPTPPTEEQSSPKIQADDVAPPVQAAPTEEKSAPRSQADDVAPLSPAAPTEEPASEPEPITEEEEKSHADVSKESVEAFNKMKIEGKAAGLKTVALLKFIQEASGDHYKKEVLEFIDNPEERELQFNAIYRSNMGGIEEFSPTFYRVLRSKALRMRFCRDFIILALEKGSTIDHGFSDFDAALLRACCRISKEYDSYYFAWLQAVQDPVVVEALKDHPPTKEFYNGYTIISIAANAEEEGAVASIDGEIFFKQTPFSIFFEDIFVGLLKEFSRAIAELDLLKGDNLENANTIRFLQQYKRALAETDIDQLDAAWEQLDFKWMDCKSHIQIVHDIETGYGDPLRVKATPDFSCRLLDDTHASSNKEISMIQGHIETFFKKRDTPVAKAGLTALSSTMAGIYYIPFSTGISLQFSFSGQSIPNRINVKTEKGVKIYFDANETRARVDLNEKLIKKVFFEAQERILDKYKPDAVEQLVWHVAAHEVGHAIYGLQLLEDLCDPAILSLLEEPRAELTAMFTLRLLYNEKVLSLEHLQRALAHFCIDGLRYFDKIDSAALEAYIVFQIYAWKVYADEGYLVVGSNKQMLIDDTKVLDVLDVFCAMFERFLACVDDQDTEALKRIFDEMSPKNSFIMDISAEAWFVRGDLLASMAVATA